MTKHQPARAPARRTLATPSIPKAPTGVRGLDEITLGGLPRGRPTLVVGASGAGKTVLSVEFLVHGIVDYEEPGVMMSFQESAAELAANVRSLGFDLDGLQGAGKLVIDHVRVDRDEIEEAGEYNLEGLFIRLEEAVGRVGARRVVLDTLENLFAGLRDRLVLRAELQRLFDWLKERAITTVVTGERGMELEAHHSFQEYVADCVIALEHRVAEEVSTRYLRVAKYRGSSHSTNEFPFVIGPRGISILPITRLEFGAGAPVQYVSSGIGGLDAMLGGKGYHRGASILIRGHSGTGKTTFAAAFADAACKRGQRCVYLTFEESAEQLVHNMRRLGIDLARWQDRGLLAVRGVPPPSIGLEEHLVAMRDLISASAPAAVVIDPISSLLTIGERGLVRRMLMRMLWFIKSRGITCLSTELLDSMDGADGSALGLSALMDTLLMLSAQERDGAYARALVIVKSRGTAHSSAIRAFELGRRGVRLLDGGRAPAANAAAPHGAAAGPARLTAKYSAPNYRANAPARAR